VAVAHWLGSLQKRALLHGTALLLFLTSLAAVALESGLGQEAIFSARHFVPMTIREEEIHVHYGHVGMVRLGTLVANKLAKPDELVAFISHIPGLYPVTKRLSPLKQLYFIWPALPSEEEAIIGEFKEKEIKWVLLHNEYIDRREDLYFHNTHPKTFKYIMDNYEMIEAGSLFKNVAVFRLRDK
ncbi:MAG: hypothetical protein V4710_08235, partial [Verrucomicrobiota bacterium]